ncbi:MAG: 50S ribosomal protein L29 [Candidatus Omnitrophica bacterium]|nr:50S ribosomal protein L29 [Candidatus Omnitrophota bacterium]MBD3268564.1 50S ribosomal protein L29 [Candidatus Omnitrophota bacterium]
MEIKEIRQLSKEELKNKLEELNKQLMELQFKRRSGVEKPHMFRVIKRDIARILTVYTEKRGEESE